VTLGAVLPLLPGTEYEVSVKPAYDWNEDYWSPTIKVRTAGTGERKVTLYCKKH